MLISNDSLGFASHSLVCCFLLPLYAVIKMTFAKYYRNTLAHQPYGLCALTEAVECAV